MKNQKTKKTSEEYSSARGILDVYENSELNQMYKEMVCLGMEHCLNPVEKKRPNIVETYFDNLYRKRKVNTLSYFLISDKEVKMNVYENDFKLLCESSVLNKDEYWYFLKNVAKECSYLYKIVKNYTEDFNKDVFIQKIREKGMVFNKYYFISFLRSEQVDVILYQLQVEIKYLKEHIKKHTKNTEKDYKDEIWFKFGLLFAKGEMNKYFTINKDNKTVMNNEFTAPKIAKELKRSNYNKYILATINDYSKDKENGNKNIFNSREKMIKIISYCENENISVDPYFKSRLPID